MWQFYPHCFLRKAKHLLSTQLSFFAQLGLSTRRSWLAQPQRSYQAVESSSSAASSHAPFFRMPGLIGSAKEEALAEAMKDHTATTAFQAAKACKQKNQKDKKHDRKRSHAVSLVARDRMLWNQSAAMILSAVWLILYVLAQVRNRYTSAVICQMHTINPNSSWLDNCWHHSRFCRILGIYGSWQRVELLYFWHSQAWFLIVKLGHVHKKITSARHQNSLGVGQVAQWQCHHLLKYTGLASR